MTTGKRLSLFFYFCLFDLNQQSMCVQLYWRTANLRRSRSAAGGGCSEAEGEQSNEQEGGRTKPDRCATILCFVWSLLIDAC